MGTRICGTVGVVDKEKTSLHVLNGGATFDFFVLTIFLHANNVHSRGICVAVCKNG